MGLFQRVKAPSNAVNASRFEMGENERPVMVEELVYLSVSSLTNRDSLPRVETNVVEIGV